MFMRQIIGFLAGACLAFGQIEDGDVSPMTPKEEALEQLLSERESPEALSKAEAKARDLGISEQAILEARFLFHVDRSEDAEIAAMLPKFLEHKKNFALEDSEIFSSVDDWLAVVEYVHAIAAMEKGDKDAFKKHITEAFWLSPRQGAVFSPHIDRVRLADAMKDVRVDLVREFPNTLDDTKTSLGVILGERKGMLLHFWSPRSPECEMTLSDFMLTAGHLIEKDVAVVSVLPETSNEVELEARKMLAGTKKKLPGAWIADEKKDSIVAQLRIQNVPVVVLLSRDGSVLFNGHPTEEKFWKSLETLNPEIARPEAVEE